MVFDYYKKLNKEQKKIYRASDEIGAIRLPNGKLLQSLVLKVEKSLESKVRSKVKIATQKLVDGINAGLRTPSVRIQVLEVRPSNEWEELHGLYHPMDGRKKASINVWMFTAKRRQVVAFRTFLRTLLHELCHHLDYELLKLEESYHTDGFYKRESSLFHQLVRKQEAG